MKRMHFFREQITLVAELLHSLKPEPVGSVAHVQWLQTVDKFGLQFSSNINFNKEDFEISCYDGKVDRLFPKPAAMVDDGGEDDDSM